MKRRFMPLAIAAFLLLSLSVATACSLGSPSAERPSEGSASALTPCAYASFLYSLDSRSFAESRYLLPNTSSTVRYLADFTQLYPDCLLTKLSEERVLATCRLERDGNDLYAYVVFEKQTRVFGEDGDPSLCEDWICYGEYYFSRSGAAIEAIKALQPGDVIAPEKYAALEDAVGNHRGYQVDEAGRYLWEDYCLTEKGVYQILWTAEAITDAPATVSEVHFYPGDGVTEEESGISLLLNYAGVLLP